MPTHNPKCRDIGWQPCGHTGRCPHIAINGQTGRVTERRRRGHIARYQAWAVEASGKRENFTVAPGNQTPTAAPQYVLPRMS